MLRLPSGAYLATSLGAALLVSACSGGDGEHAADESAPERAVAEATMYSHPIPPDPVDEARESPAREVGGPAAAHLAQGLVGRLGEALAEGGPLHALDFCAREAIPLTESLTQEHDNRLRLKRATTRPRNPANAPDLFEARVLHYLEALEANERGSAPETMVAAGPEGAVRFYRTLRTAPNCLACHGAEEEMDPEVLELIRQRYPNDEATGYAAGDLRGVIRVEIP